MNEQLISEIKAKVPFAELAKKYGKTHEEIEAIATELYYTENKDDMRVFVQRLLEKNGFDPRVASDIADGTANKLQAKAKRYADEFHNAD